VAEHSFGREDVAQTRNPRRLAACGLQQVACPPRLYHLQVEIGGLLKVSIKSDVIIIRLRIITTQDAYCCKIVGRNPQEHTLHF